MVVRKGGREARAVARLVSSSLTAENASSASDSVLNDCFIRSWRVSFSSWSRLIYFCRFLSWRSLCSCATRAFRVLTFSRPRRSP